MPRTPPETLLKADFPQDVVRILKTLREAGHAAFLVGGSIRDLLLGKTAKDYDVATSARAEVVLKLFKKVIPTGIKHGTVTVHLGQHQVEVTTFRGEGAYLDGRRPSEVVFHDDVVQDLARRDFTMNAMAYDPATGTFEDPFDGAHDLEKRLVRCVGEARARFSEDGLRCMRAVRFAAVLDFHIEDSTFAAIPETLPTFAKVAAERVRDELLKMLTGPHPGHGLGLMKASGLLAAVIPELLPLCEGTGLATLQARLGAVHPDAELRLAALLYDLPPATVEAVLERLKLPRRSIDAVKHLVTHRGFALGTYPDDAALRRGLLVAGAEWVGRLFQLARAQAAALSDPSLASGLDAGQARAEAMLATKPPLSAGDLALNGKRIMDALGERPGPRIGLAVKYLLDQVVEEPSRNDPATLEALLKAWAAGSEGPKKA